jgi:hypothetical protein
VWCFLPGGEKGCLIRREVELITESVSYYYEISSYLSGRVR